ncbi:hypothetical protein HJC23_009861 [Cyclotella cryptica]|uniref:TsaA-like domain-containing protein n=1 Tax=Cyclotella cryptica TaxID=29204 RepID=A0ABD3QBM6_9STRA
MSSRNGSFSTAATVTITVVAAASAFITASLIFCRRHQEALAKISKLEETRSAERKGRIRAEMKLRTHLKNDSADGASDLETSHGNVGDDANKGHKLTLHCIGTVVSPYTKRMGTPRQGALVPSGRGYIQLRIPVECVEGLELYSHAWVLFTFHANTDTPSVPAAANSGDSQFLNLTKTKIRPPRGNGIKVGMLATRSPHRPNNIGLSLVKVVQVDKKERRLHIAAFDLVNGTPVYDIKPVVPWDIPGHHDNLPLTVPAWVSQDDALQKVEFTSLARDSLETHIRSGKLDPLYTFQNDGLFSSIDSICEVLAQDPRASNTNSSNKRGTKETTTNSDVYRFVFCSVEVLFRVSATGVVVEDITELDLNNVPHVDGIPVLLDR